MMTKSITVYLQNFISLVSSLEFFDGIKKLDHCDVLLLCHDVDRSLSLNGKAYSPLIDSVRKDLEIRGLRCSSIAHFGSKITKEKGYGNPISFNSTYFLYRILKKVSNFFGLPIAYKNDPFTRMLKKTKAKLIITIGSSAELAFAARLRGVFHVELLHGIGYAFLPWGWDKLSREYLPQGVLSLDNVSTKRFLLLQDRGIETRTIPHPFLKLWSPNKSHLIPAEFKLNFTYPKKYLKHILVSLTWGYAGDHNYSDTHFAGILENGLFFNEIGELVREEGDIFWHFRFHPVQLRMSKYKKLLQFMDDFVSSNPNSDWRESSRVPLPSVAVYCQGNIVMSSMACYDAAVVGLPSLMICPTVQKGAIYQDAFSELEIDGYLTKAKICKEMLRNWVHKTERIKPRLSNLNDDHAWEDAVKWMLNRSGLEQILNQHSVLK